MILKDNIEFGVVPEETAAHPGTRLPGEPFDTYALRLYENAKEYGLTCEGIGAVLNAITGENKTESAWRKYYTAFRKGIEYATNYDEALVKTRILALSDFHFPFQKPIETFAPYKGKIDLLVLNGDLLDCQSISKFLKTYRINPMQEIIGARQYFIDLIDYIHPKKVVVTYGNHELRLGTYMAKTVDNELQELVPMTALDYIFDDGIPHYDRQTRAKTFYEPIRDYFEDIEIEYCGNWWYQLGENGAIFCHPKAYSSSIMKTTEKAVGWFRNSGIVFPTLVMAHTHRIGSYKLGNTMIYEQGCLCETKKMAYADGMLVNEQKEGFLYLCLDENGKPVEKATKLITLN